MQHQRTFLSNDTFSLLVHTNGPGGVSYENDDTLIKGPEF